MIQVLGLRDYVAHGVPRKRETFFQNSWRFASVQDVFNADKVQALVATIPEKDRFNLYFTVADCYEQPGRQLKEQWAIPFDIDGLALAEGQELQEAERAARAGADALGIRYEELGVVFTGNGVQFFIFLNDSPIIDEDYFERTREHYGVLAKRIQNLLLERGIEGKVDTSVWSKARLMRLPFTENRKPSKPTRTAQLMNGPGVRMHYDLVEQSGVTEIRNAPVVPDAALKNYPKPDTEAICEGCEFLKFCKRAPEKVSEPQWYAMLSITARLDNGDELSHEYSSGHAGYNHYETENKIAQARAAAGPRTCDSINSIWGECHTCEYHGRVTSPIMIKGENFIASKDFGYRERRVTEKGTPVPGKPAYLDLIKEFGNEHPFKSVSDIDSVYIYNGKHWLVMDEPHIKNWMRQRVRHHPNSAEMNEFVAQLKAENVTTSNWFHAQSYGKLNFTNGVLDILTLEQTAHSPEHGFFSVLPFPYDPRATAPRWEKFLLEVMGNDVEMAELLKEFGGYAISGDSCWYQKAMVLLGEGANGKSVYMEMLGEVVGNDNHATVSMGALSQDTMRYQLVNKLFNYSEETNVRALADSELFKTLVGGGKMSVKQLYVQPYQVANRAKIIMAANDMPRTNDNTYGLYRRLIIVPFNVRFAAGQPNHDYHIKDKLRAELPGIANSLIAAYKRFTERRVLIGDEKVNAIVDEYKAESDTVRMFLDLCVEDKEGGEISFSELYEDYRIACDKLGRKWLGSTEFARQLYRNRPQLHHESVRRNGKKMRMVYGVTVAKDF